MKTTDIKTQWTGKKKKRREIEDKITTMEKQIKRNCSEYNKNGKGKQRNMVKQLGIHK